MGQNMHDCIFFLRTSLYEIVSIFLSSWDFAGFASRVETNSIRWLVNRGQFTLIRMLIRPGPIYRFTSASWAKPIRGQP